jgi:hypothetical protein
VMMDGPAVLGWATWREIDWRHFLALVDEGLARRCSSTARSAGRRRPSPIWSSVRSARARWWSRARETQGSPSSGAGGAGRAPRRSSANEPRPSPARCAARRGGSCAPRPWRGGPDRPGPTSRPRPAIAACSPRRRTA